MRLLMAIYGGASGRSRGVQDRQLRDDWGPIVVVWLDYCLAAKAEAWVRTAGRSSSLGTPRLAAIRAGA